MKLLEMKHIKKEFDGLGVLKDISLAVEEGEILSIIGPSGSGKSTLLRCATTRQIDGRRDLLYGERVAYVDDQGTRKYPKGDQARKYILILDCIQNFNLFPHYSVMKKISRMHQSEFRSGIRMRCSKRHGSCSQRWAFRIKKMRIRVSSGGQCQRVAIARALAPNPKILFSMSRRVHLIRS